MDNATTPGVIRKNIRLDINAKGAERLPERDELGSRGHEQGDVHAPEGGHGKGRTVIWRAA
ncbi:MAG: hypothetical protein M3326_11470 [Actinomycetota bacterium]|nr:hypothetical protein [Actinomycetota bacterium]